MLRFLFLFCCLPTGLFAQTPIPEGEAPVVVPPVLLEFVEADYPPAALAARQQADVVLALTVNADGSVTDVEVVTSAEPEPPAAEGASASAFDDAARAAVVRFRFQPATQDGQAIPVRLQYRYAFTLKTVVEEVASAAPTGRLEGQLLEAGTRRPLGGVSVQLPDLKMETFTDAQGRFAFAEVPPGRVTLRITDAEYADLEDDETVEAGRATDVRYYLARDAFGDTVTVVGRRPQKEVVRRTVTVQELRTLPGTQGDALKAVQNLPGVARVSAGFAGDRIILRGGGGSQAYVDRHPVPLAFHFGGLRSTVASALIDSLDLYPGNFAVDYGRVNGGVVDVRLRDPQVDAIHGYAEADIFDAGALVEGPVGDGGLAIAFRRSYIDGVLALALSDDLRRRFATAPRYYDGQILYHLADGPHDLRLLLYGSSDRIVLLSDAARGGFISEWAGGQGRWRQRVSDVLTHELSLSWLVTHENAQFNDDFKRDLLWNQVTFRDDLGFQFTPELGLRLGVDAEVKLGTLTLRGEAGGQPREGETPPDGPPKANDAEIAESTTDIRWATPAVFAEGVLKFGPLTVLPALRLEWFGATGDVEIQPRLTLRTPVVEGTTLKAGIGLYAEQLSPDDLSTAFGNPDLVPERALHVSLGVEQQLVEGLTLDMTVFYKAFFDLVTRSDDPSLGLANQGDGRAYGLEVLLRKELTSRLFGWVAYTLQRSERRDQPGAAYRLFDVDQTHNLTAVAQYRFTPTWELGVRWRFVTGNPYTPATGSVLDSDDLTYLRLDGATNSKRVAPFHSLDVRLDKHWVFDTWRLTTYLEAQNAYNRENISEIGYNYDYTIAEDQLDLPIIPSIGVRGEW